MITFATEDFNGDPCIFTERDFASTVVAAFSPGNKQGQLVEVLADDESWVAGPADNFVKVRLIDGTVPPREGWMQRGHIGEPTNLRVFPVPIDSFVQSCGQQELAATQGDDPAH